MSNESESAGGLIDTEDFARRLREKSIIGNDRFLITNFRGSLQQKDLSGSENCQGFGRVHVFRDQKNPSWVPNPLPHQVAAWRLSRPIEDMRKAQLFQNASCNWRCWYCYVDFALLEASRERSDFKTADELVELFLNETDRPRLIDLSGGQPDIIPEWPIRMMEALLRKGLDHDYFLWMDDNLSLYYPWQYLSRTELDFMRSYANFGRVGCFKGYSPQTFQENTRARPEMLGRQIDILRKWTREGIDTYGYITLTTSSLDGMRNSLREFMDAIQSKIAHSFLLRIIPLEIREYTPTLKRMNSVHMKAIENQYSGLANWLDELDDRYSSKERGTPIYEIPCSD